MKSFALLASLLALFLVSQAHAGTYDDVLEAVKTLQPANSPADGAEIATGVTKAAARYGLDWSILVSILSQESSLRKDPQKCYDEKQKCSDLGVAQINWKTWGKALSLDRSRLLTDAVYAVDVMGKILARYKAQYGAESLWWGRYHNGNPTLLRGYVQKVLVHHAKIKVPLKEHEHGRRIGENHSSHLGNEKRVFAGRDL